jgi:hypothetical protein
LHAELPTSTLSAGDVAGAGSWTLQAIQLPFAWLCRGGGTQRSPSWARVVVVLGNGTPRTQLLALVSRCCALEEKKLALCELKIQF